MNGVSLVPCECPLTAEQSAINGKLVIDPVLYPDGVPLHPSSELRVQGVWIQNPASSLLTIWFGYGTAADAAACIQIAPGADKYFGVVNEAEKLVAIPRLRIAPYRWKINSTAAVNAAVLLFL